MEWFCTDAESAGIGATDIPAATFTVGFSSAYDGQFYISLGSTQTRNLAAGRYEYNVLLTPSLVTETILNTSIAVGATAGIGTTEFTINKLDGVAMVILFLLELQLLLLQS